MNSRKSTKLTLVVLLGAATALRLSADKLDLDRVVPVPGSEPIPVLDFFRPHILQDPILNPSGTHIAAVISASEDHTSLLIYDLKNQKMDTIGARGDNDIELPAWLGDDRICFLMTVHKLGGFSIAGARIDSLHSPYPIVQNISASLVSIPHKDRLHPVFAFAPHGVMTGKYGEVMALDATTDSGKLLNLDIELISKDLEDASEQNIHRVVSRYPVLETPEGFGLGYYADKEGKLEFGVTSTNGIQSLHHLVGDKWQKCPEDLDEIQIIGAGDKPGEIVVLGSRENNQPRPLEIMEADTGKVVEVLVQDKAYDAPAGLYRDPVSQLIVGANYNRAGPHVEWFSEAYRNLQKMVDGLFPGQVVRIIGNDEHGKMVLLNVSSDRQPAKYVWVDLETHKAGLIKDSAPWIDPARMQPMNVIKFKTRDGRQLDAFVTMPAGANKQNPPPLVVLARSSSGWANSWGFDSEVQFLASRGYAVLQPNFRGAPGSSWKFPTQDEWAYRKMHEDVTDATKAFLAAGLVDRNRVAIMGQNFGSFLAISGAAYEPGLYRCVIAISGVPDWAKYIAEDKKYQYSSAWFAIMQHHMGDTDKDPEKWDAIAPLRHADQIRSALFYATGEFDDSFATSGMKSVVSAVERNHLPTESKVYSNESGWISHLANKVDLYTRIEAFLAKNLK